MQILLIGNQGSLQKCIATRLDDEHNVLSIHSEDFVQMQNGSFFKEYNLPSIVVFLGRETSDVTKMFYQNFGLPQRIFRYSEKNSCKFIYLSSQIVLSECFFDYGRLDSMKYFQYMVSKVSFDQFVMQAGSDSVRVLVGSVFSNRGNTPVEKVFGLYQRNKYLSYFPIPNISFSFSPHAIIADSVVAALDTKHVTISALLTFSVKDIRDLVRRNNFQLISQFVTVGLVGLAFKLRLITQDRFLYLNERKLLDRVNDSIILFSKHSLEEYLE